MCISPSHLDAKPGLPGAGSLGNFQLRVVESGQERHVGSQMGLRWRTIHYLRSA